MWYNMVQTSFLAVCNQLHVVVVVVAWLCRICKTSLTGLVAPKKAKKNGPDQTLEH